VTSLQAQATAVAPAKNATAGPTDLSSLASTARFEQVLATLKAMPAGDARTASYQADVERYQQHQVTWKAARQKAYDKALSKMVERTKAGLVDPALASAIEAHSLAPDPRGMLADERTVTLIKGDGIGPEIADAVKHIFTAAAVPITWEEADAGLACIERTGNGLPQATLDSILRNKVALKGPTTTPICQSPSSMGSSASRSKLAPVSALNSDFTRAAR
jgi:hypothetical protein